MISNVEPLARPSWLTAEDERPHRAEDVPNWSENYLSYFWSPETEVGAYFHLSRLPGDVARWDEILFVALPDGRWLVSRSVSPQRDVDGVEVNGNRWTCEVPFERWTKEFRGSAQLVTTEELEAGALADGYRVPVDMRLTFDGLSATYDWGTAHLEQSWATGHYEQHMLVDGELRWGDETVSINGAGLRDHSWGPRDYRELGNSTWIQAQFPESGRCFMVARVTGVAPAPELTYAVTCDRTGQTEATASEILIATTWEDADQPYELELTTADGQRSTIKAEVLRSTRCSFHGAAQMVPGLDRRPAANHHYVDGFTRFEWDGEIGYGVTEYAIEFPARS